MANTLTPTDVYGIVNAMAAEMFGANNTVTAIDTSTFATVGEKMLRTGLTNTLDSLNVVIGKRIYVSRRYNGRFKIILKTDAEWGGITLKDSFYAKPMSPTSYMNTDINGTQLVDGASIDPWVISKKYPLQISFCGQKTLQFEYTRWLSQLRAAFRSPEDMAAFISAMLVEIANDLETKIEAENRLQILNAIGATYNTGTARQVVNLTTEYNTYYNLVTPKTTAELLTTDLDSFVAFMVMRIENDMELMRERNELFHIFPAKNDDSGNALTLVRHTPPEARRLLLYMPLIRAAQKNVFPSLFNDSYLKLENFESCEYFQNPNEPMKVSLSAVNQLNTTTGQSEDGSAVALDNVVGLLFDRDALATQIRYESVMSTPPNVRGDYVNTVYKYVENYIYDPTENMILYYMAD